MYKRDKTRYTDEAAAKSPNNYVHKDVRLLHEPSPVRLVSLMVVCLSKVVLRQLLTHVMDHQTRIAELVPEPVTVHMDLAS